MTKQAGYHSNLLRLRQTHDGTECAWSASLVQPRTQETPGVATLDALFHFLRDQTAPRPGQANGPVEEP
jgi:hypothetical protein